MGTRRKSRELGLQILFQVDVGDLPFQEVSKNFWKIWKVSDEVRDFALSISGGVIENLSSIDGIITKYAQNWDIGRINNIDRNILRMAIYEIVYSPDIPYKVAINEAIEISKKFGTPDSGKFINGVLDKIAKKEKRTNVIKAEK